MLEKDLSIHGALSCAAVLRARGRVGAIDHDVFLE